MLKHHLNKRLWSSKSLGLEKSSGIQVKALLYWPDMDHCRGTNVKRCGKNHVPEPDVPPNLVGANVSTRQDGSVPQLWHQHQGPTAENFAQRHSKGRVNLQLGHVFFVISKIKVRNTAIAWITGKRWQSKRTARSIFSGLFRGGLGCLNRLASSWF